MRAVSFKRMLGARSFGTAAPRDVRGARHTKPCASKNQRRPETSHVRVGVGALGRNPNADRQLVCEPSTGTAAKGARSDAQRRVPMTVSGLIPRRWHIEVTGLDH